jgi:hypothetical protein
MFALRLICNFGSKKRRLLRYGQCQYCEDTLPTMKDYGTEGFAMVGLCVKEDRVSCESEVRRVDLQPIRIMGPLDLRRKFHTDQASLWTRCSRSGLKLYLSKSKRISKGALLEHRNLMVMTSTNINICPRATSHPSLPLVSKAFQKLY